MSKSRPFETAFKAMFGALFAVPFAILAWGLIFVIGVLALIGAFA